MEKSTIRWCGVGLTLACIAGAVGLAQRDARNAKRDSEATNANKIVAEATPLQVPWEPAERLAAPEGSSGRSLVQKGRRNEAGSQNVTGASPELNEMGSEFALASHYTVRANDDPNPPANAPSALPAFPSTVPSNSGAGDTASNGAPNSPVAEVAQLPSFPDVVNKTRDGLGKAVSGVEKSIQQTAQAIGDAASGGLNAEQKQTVDNNAGTAPASRSGGLLDPRNLKKALGGTSAPTTLPSVPGNLPAATPVNAPIKRDVPAFPLPGVGASTSANSAVSHGSNASSGASNRLSDVPAIEPSAAPIQFTAPASNTPLGTSATPLTSSPPSLPARASGNLQPSAPASTNSPKALGDYSPAAPSLSEKDPATFGTPRPIDSPQSNAARPLGSSRSIPSDNEVPSFQGNTTNGNSPVSRSDAQPGDSYRAYSSLGSDASPMVRLASATPGERSIDGTQSPTLQILKRAPEEIRVGKPATFTIVVRNSGSTTAHDVRVVDRVPTGTRFVAANPETEPQEDGSLSWEIGDLPVGNERMIQLQLVPEAEGEIGSVASVSFSALASVRTVSTLPKLEVTQTAPERTIIGERFGVRMKITNTGTGVAKKAALEVDLPANVKCSAGPQIVAEVGDLAPGKSQTVDLPLIASEPGQIELVVRAVAEDGIVADNKVAMEITAPQLKVNIQGPSRRFVERQAKYVFQVENQGTATATNVELTAQLPKGFRFNGTGQKGQYDPAKHAVLWSLEELPPGVPASVEMTVLPVEVGSQSVRFLAEADLNCRDQAEAVVAVEGQSELAFNIEDDNDPVELDGVTTYTVRVSNSGSRPDENIQLSIDLPDGGQLESGVDAPVASQVQGNQLVFAPVAKMTAKDSIQYRFSIRWTGEGMQVIRARLTSKNRNVAVTQEESTEVYLDR